MKYSRWYLKKLCLNKTKVLFKIEYFIKILLLRVAIWNSESKKIILDNKTLPAN